MKEASETQLSSFLGHLEHALTVVRARMGQQCCRLYDSDDAKAEDHVTARNLGRSASRQMQDISGLVEDIEKLQARLGTFA